MYLVKEMHYELLLKRILLIISYMLPEWIWNGMEMLQAVNTWYIISIW